MTILFSLFKLVGQSATPILQVKAAELGQAYLEEIMLRRFDENSPAGNGKRCRSTSAPFCSTTLGLDPGETSRSDFDDVDDYAVINNEAPRDINGNLRPGFSGFSVDVSVFYAGSDLGLANNDMKRVEVTITTPESNRFVFSQYKGNF